jgi:hypothetical protein
MGAEAEPAMSIVMIIASLWLLFCADVWLLVR